MSNQTSQNMGSLIGLNHTDASNISIPSSFGKFGSGSFSFYSLLTGIRGQLTTKS